MNAGKLRHRVTIQQPTLTSDGMGGGTQTWANVSTVWADIKTTNVSNTSNAEEWTSDQFRSNNYYIVILRYRGDLQTDMRLLYKNRILEILSIVNIDERNREIRLYCREGG